MELLDLASRIVGLMALIAMVFGTIERLHQPWTVRAVGHGLAFGVAATICMLFPATLADGTNISGRSLFLAFAAAFGGVVPWAIAALLTTALHFTLNDVTTAQLVQPLLVAGILGLSWRWTVAKRFGRSFFSLIGLGVWTSMVSLLLLVLSASGSIIVFVTTYPVILLVCLAGALILGAFIDRELRHFNAEELWRIEAFSDALTTLSNKRAFQADYQSAHAAKAAFCLIIRDIDHFKKVNDTYGHETGDAVLRHVGMSISTVLPPGTKAYRLGGEEFAVIAPDFDMCRGHDLAERLRKSVSGGGSGTPAKLPAVTTSAGVAVTAAGVEQFELMSAADAALYYAKSSGRDRVVSWADVVRDRAEGLAKLASESM
jgi:diguanylate cyclase